MEIVIEDVEPILSEQDYVEWIEGIKKLQYIKESLGNVQKRTCENCSKWYRNNHGGEKCVWNNKEVPKKNDYCSRFEKNI